MRNQNKKTKVYMPLHRTQNKEAVGGIEGLRSANIDKVVEDPEGLHHCSAHDDLEFLPANAVGLGPVAVVLLHSLRSKGCHVSGKP